MAEFQRTLVTAALPYANGPLHLGHLAGVYVPSDIYVRFLRLMDEEVLFICGSDEHGVPITLAAEKAGISPKELADRNYESFCSSFEGLGIRFDNFSQTSREIHHRTAQEFFLDLHAQGVLEQGTSLQFWGEATQRFYPDRYVEGICPYCDKAGARGDQCESCGSQMEAEKLIDPKSVVDDSPLSLKETTHWFFPMGKYQEWLEKWQGSHPEWRQNVRNYCKGWFERGLGNRAITRDLEWGIPVPLEGHEGKVLYVWFDAPIGYISATREWAAARGNEEDWRRWWQDEGTRLLHFIGKDNLIFHALLFPEMLHAHSEAYVVPDNVPANEFLNLEGQKLSTSRGHAVWLPDYLEEFEPDSLRYCLARNLPEAKDTNFSWDDFQARHNNELADILGNFVNRTLTFAHKYFDGKVPQLKNPNAADEAALAGMQVAATKMEAQLRAFEIRSAIETALLLAKEANRYFDEAQPWATRKTDLDRCGNSIHVCCQYLRHFAGLFGAFLPHSMGKLWAALQVDGELEVLGWPTDGRALPGGHALGKCEILYVKLEDELIEKQRARLRAAAPSE